MTDREKLIELLVNFVEVDAWDNGEFIEKDIDFQKIASDLIAHGVTVQKWISVEDRLPEEKGEYLVVFHPCWWDDVKWTKTCVGIDTFRGKTAWAKKKFQRVTHWMPMPKPPKEDNT